jgi:hypothetical protein
MLIRSVGTVVTTSYLYDVNDERIAEGAKIGANRHLISVESGR